VRRAAFQHEKDTDVLAIVDAAHLLDLCAVFCKMPVQAVQQCSDRDLVTLALLACELQQNVPIPVVGNGRALLNKDNRIVIRIFDGQLAVALISLLLLDSGQAACGESRKVCIEVFLCEIECSSWLIHNARLIQVSAYIFNGRPG